MNDIPRHRCFRQVTQRSIALAVAVLGLSIVAVSETAFAQTFKWRTQDAKLETVNGTNGVAVADYDGDGDLDVYFVVYASYDPVDTRTWNRLFSNRGDGTFSAITGAAAQVVAGRDSSVSVSSMGYKMGASWGDYDNDGWPDLFLTHFGPNQLLHNNGDGTFTDVTHLAGVAGRNQLSSSALWVDYDHDGDLDLYVSNYQDFASASPDKRNWLYENLGGGEFAEVAETAGVNDGGLTWTTIALDVNNDGLLDLYLANDFGRNKLYVNNGDKTFSEETAAYGVEDEHHGMGITIGDYDRNGFFDLYVTNISESHVGSETNPLFLNSGQDLFVDGAEDAGISRPGWGWGTEFFDLENDGDEDLFVATGYFEPDYVNVLFRNVSESGNLGFEKITDSAGLADSAAARGLAVYDFDDDGDQDLLISNVLDVPSLYENPMVSGNWVKIELEGTLSNRSAFGSVVEVSAGGRTYRRYHHGAQFLGQHILPVHVGLGDAMQIDHISVRWTNGHVDAINDVAVNQTIRIKETVGIVGTAVSEHELVRDDALRQLGNYPNPFRASTNIMFEIGAPGEVELQIFDALGRTLWRIQRMYTSPGVKAIEWNAVTDDGNRIGSGIYVFRLRNTVGRLVHSDSGIVVLTE